MTRYRLAPPFALWVIGLAIAFWSITLGPVDHRAILLAGWFVALMAIPVWQKTGQFTYALLLHGFGLAVIPLILLYLEKEKGTYGIWGLILGAFIGTLAYVWWLFWRPPVR